MKAAFKGVEFLSAHAMVIFALALALIPVFAR
jgi:hypothetical protein